MLDKRLMIPSCSILAVSLFGAVSENHLSQHHPNVEILAILDAWSFYAAMQGQAGDKGDLVRLRPGHASTDNLTNMGNYIS